MTQRELRDERRKVLAGLEKAKTDAQFKYLKENCDVIKIEVTKPTFFGTSRFPEMIAKNCKRGCNGNRCDTCDCLVSYSLAKNEVYCLKSQKP